MRWFLFVLIIAGLAACTHAPEAPSVLPNDVSSAAVAGTTGTLVLTLPPIAKAGAVVPWLQSPALLSAATQSVTLTVNKAAAGTFALSTSSPGCATTAAGLVCKVTATVASGQDAIALTTHAGSAGSGAALATNSFKRHIYPNQQNLYSVPMTGIAQKLGILLLGGKVRQGHWAAVRIVAVGIDGAQNVIPSTSVVGPNGAGLPTVTVSYAGFLTGQLMNGEPYDPTASFACCGVLAAAFPYDGVQTGSEKFTLEAQGYRPASTTLRVVPGNTIAAMLVTTSYDSSRNPLFGATYVAQFALNAHGNVAPARAFVPPYVNGTNVFGEDASGNYWAGATHYSNLGATLGTLTLPSNQRPFGRDASGNIYTLFATNTGHCSIFEYRGNVYGKSAPIRQVNYHCADSVPAVDGNGDILVSNSAYSPGVPATIAEYAEGSGSGSVAPSRTIKLAAPSASTYYQIFTMDCDASGNVYVGIDQVFNGTSQIVVKIASGLTNPVTVLSNVPVQFLAVDDGGTIYARTWVSDSLNAIQVFPPGSTTPTQTITGTSSELDGVEPIAVPRAWTSSPTG
jgi:hypothetical protein